MGARERPCKPRHSGPKEQSNLKITSLSKLTKNTIKKSGSEKISSMARQSTGRKWTLQEEIRLLALFVVVGPDWPKISEYFEDRQPSTIKCKLNNMLRYALVGTNDRVDDVGRFTKRIANEIKSKSCTLFQYHSQYLSKLPLTKMEPFIRKELDTILPQLELQAKAESSNHHMAADKNKQKAMCSCLPSATALQQFQPVSAMDYSDLPLPQGFNPSWFNSVFPCPPSRTEPITQWKSFPYDPRCLSQPSLTESPFKLLPPGIGTPPPFYPPAPLNGSRSTPLSALSSIDPPYSNEVCGYSLRIPVS